MYIYVHLTFSLCDLSFLPLHMISRLCYHAGQRKARVALGGAAVGYAPAVLAAERGTPPSRITGELCADPVSCKVFIWEARLRVLSMLLSKELGLAAGSWQFSCYPR